MKNLLRSIIAAMAAAAMAAPAAAQQAAQAFCDDRKTVISALGENFAERPVSIGIANNGAMVEVFASPEGTWTIIATLPTGLSCLMAAGEHWEFAPVKAAKAGIEM